MTKTICAVLTLAVTLAAQSARDLTEFTLFKRTEPIKVGDIGLILKGTDVNKQRFNLVIIVDEHRIERKDMDIKVPFYVYGDGKTQPHELVVTKVGNDQIVGRLMSPK